MKKLLLAGVAAAGLTVAATGAQAAATIGVSPAGGQANDVFDARIEGWYGANLYLIAGGNTTATLTLLGAESGFQNRFVLDHVGGTETYTVGPNANSDDFVEGTGTGTDSRTVTLAPGLLDFSFFADLLGGPSVDNGANVDPGTPGAPNFFLTFSSAMNLGQLASWDTTINNITAGGGRSVIIALDDGGAQADDNHDDLVVLLTLDNGSFSIPEPASMALLGMGLLGLGFAARRRRG